MIDNTILGYAVLNYFSDKGMDFLDSYIPLFCKTLSEYECDSIDRDTMKPLLVKKYGMETITLGAVDSILKRMVSLGYLHRDHHVCFINREKYQPMIKNIRRQA